MLLDILLLIVAMALIAKGADWFVESAVSIAEATHIPKAIIGATIVSIATTLPEILVSFMAALKGSTDMAVGNVIGSLICNIGLAFGLVVAISTVPVQRRKLFLEQGMLMIAAGIVLFMMCLGQSISRLMAVVMLGLFCAYMVYSVIKARGHRKKELEQYLQEVEEAGGMPTKITVGTMKKEILFFIIGSACVVGGSRLLVGGGIKLAEILNINERIIGLTFMAIGTSLPEIITCVTSALKGHRDISFGNVIGANIIDVTLAIGAAGAVMPLRIDSNVRMLDLPVMLLLMVLMIVFGRTKNIFHRWEGAVLVGIYAAYMAIVFFV
jgi:cation:H+ antiporter